MKVVDLDPHAGKKPAQEYEICFVSGETIRVQVTHFSIMPDTKDNAHTHFMIFGFDSVKEDAVPIVYVQSANLLYILKVQ